MSRIALSLCAVITAIGLTTATQADTIDFDSFTLGDVFGASSQPVAYQTGDLIPNPNTGDLIDMTLEDYHYGNSTDFWNATVVDGEDGNALQLDNIGVKFDFNGLGHVNYVELEYIIRDQVTLQNFGVSVDGTAEIIIKQDQFFTDMTQVITTSTGVTMTIKDLSDAPGRRFGRITLESADPDGIASFQIGGQELEIDNVVATPEPGSLALLGLAVAGLIYNRKTRVR